MMTLVIPVASVLIAVGVWVVVGVIFAGLFALVKRADKRYYRDRRDSRR